MKIRKNIKKTPQKIMTVKSVFKEKLYDTSYPFGRL